VLVAGVWFAWPSEWLGSRELHTLMELLAMLLAFFVSALALARYYSRKSKAFLYIATAFVGTGLLDGYHTAVTSSFVAPLLPSELGSLIPWSWLASRSFLGLFLVFAWRAETRGDLDVAPVDERKVYGAAFLLTLLSFLFFAFAPLPRAYYPEWFFHRPQEFVPALAFGLALIGFYRIRRWEEEAFHRWLVLSLLAGLASQALYMPLATTNFDVWFDLAHMLKVVSYALVLAGLLGNTLYAFREAEDSVQRLGTLNAELAEAGKQFESLVEGAPYGILVTDLQGRITLVNGRAENMFGYTRTDLVDKPIEALVPAASRSDSRFATEHAIDDDEGAMAPNREVEVRRADGSRFWAELTLVPVRTGARDLILATVVDTTKKRLIEAEREKHTRELARSNHDLAEFAYVASHDLQEPLRVVSNFIQLLEVDYADQLDDNAREYIHYAVDGAQRMRAMLNDLLDYSRVGADIEFKSIDLNTLLDVVKADFELALEEAGGRIQVEELPTVVSDRTLLLQVVRNLVGNAIKFRKEGQEPVIEVSARRSEEGVEVTVRDEGIGMNPDMSDRIFELFQRLHVRGKYPGKGIGLAIVRKSVENQGGRIWVETAVGQGTSFHFTIPDRREPQAVDGPPSSNP